MRPIFGESAGIYWVLYIDKRHPWEVAVRSYKTAERRTEEFAKLEAKGRIKG